MSQGRRRITVVNDNPEFLDLMNELLEEASGYDVTAIDGDTLHDIEPIRATRPNLLIIDLRMRQEGISGWDVLLAVRGDPQLRELPMILCTGDLQGLEERAEAIAQDPRVRTLTKPFHIQDLQTLVEAIVGPATARSS